MRTPAAPQLRRLSPREAELISLWKRERVTEVSIEDLRQKVGEAAAPRVASALVMKGALLRVHPGRYLLPTKHSEAHVPVLLAVTAALRGEPHYIGGVWAMFLQDMTESVRDEPVDVFVLGRRPTRELAGTEVRFHALPADALTYGLTTVDVDEVKVKVSDAERTALDFLDRAHLFGGLDEGVGFFREYLLPLLDPTRLVKHARQGSTDATRRRLGTMLERMDVDRRTLATLQQGIGNGSALISLFPKRPRRGPINPRWMVVENAPEFDKGRRGRSAPARWSRSGRSR